MTQAIVEKEFLTLRKKMAGDKLRPRYHFQSPAYWINDPHGLIEWQGRYHLFYQYNPNGPYHGSIHWGHAVSDDLVHWRDLPIALTPGPEIYDQDGIWTGCLINDNGRPTIFYTAIHPQTMAAAVGSDDLISWKKLKGNPLITAPPQAIGPLAGGHFRDPFIWKKGDGWYMLMASKIEGLGGQILLYHSTNLRQWAYRGIFLGGDSNITEPFWQGTMWECPNYLDFGDRQVLFLSVQATPTDHLYAVYFSGRREDDRFLPEQSDILVHGGSFYAPQAMRLSDGRYVMFGWLHEERSRQACQEAGWNGAHSLPLVLDLLPDGSVGLSPAKELRKLRGHVWSAKGITLYGEMEHALSQVNGRALEIKLQLQAGNESESGLIVFCSPDGQEQTRIICKQQERQLFIERDQSSLDQRANRNPASMPVAIAPGEPLDLHIFIDHSIIEIFANGHLYLACRVYPTMADSVGIRLFSRQGKSAVESLNIWPLKSIWPEPAS